MGPDFWSYGIDNNRHTLETMARYSFEQGLATAFPTWKNSSPNSRSRAARSAKLSACSKPKILTFCDNAPDIADPHNEKEQPARLHYAASGNVG
jgi:hypothetical protein